MALPRPPARPRRLVYLGTPEMAVPPLRALAAAGFEIPLVVSRPDKRRGRGGALTPSPVKAAALDLGLETTDDLAAAVEIDAELGVVVAYGRIIPTPVLEQLPMVNIHFSLLPRWRGAAPVERALLAGDERTGVCLMAVDEQLDTGDVFARRALVIGGDETAAALRERLVDAGTELLVRSLQEGLGEPEPQTGEPTYAEKLTGADFEIDWHRPAIELHRLVRVGGAFTTFRGKRLKIWTTSLSSGLARRLDPGELDGAVVGTGDGVLELVTVQPEGKGRVDAPAWLRGARPAPDERLGAA
jgi:methionyl-tRNA formyltransferase